MKLSTLINIASGCIFMILAAACSYKPYNPDRPDAYFEYWCDPRHRKNSLPRVIDKGFPDELEGVSEKECLEGYRAYSPEKI